MSGECTLQCFKGIRIDVVDIADASEDRDLATIDNTQLSEFN